MCGPSLKQGIDAGTFKKLQEDMTAEQKASKTMTSRWMSIGFGRNHDANLMNKIGQMGSDIGNFIFVDTAKADWNEDVKVAMEESLQQGMAGGGALKC